MWYRDPTREIAGDARRDLLDAAVVLGAHRATACLRPADALPPAGTSSRPGRGRPSDRPTARERCRLGIKMTIPGQARRPRRQAIAISGA
jgi:hypothetical protein